MRFTSSIVQGHGRGKLLGYPTFNLEIPTKLDIRHGIYACYVWIQNNLYLGAMHYGPVPTFDQTDSTLEIFVLDYSSTHHISKITFEVQDYLRPIQTFSTESQLTHQIKKDVTQVRKLLSLNLKSN